MKNKIRPNVYVKVFNLTNSYGYLTEEDFNKFKQKFEEKQDLYFNEDVNDYCFSSFREMTKEIKRAANNAGLKAKLIKVDYETFENCIKVKSLETQDINFIVSIAKIYNKKIRDVNFVITKIEAKSTFSIDNSLVKTINIDDDMMDRDSITYTYQQYKFDTDINNRRCLV